MIYPLRFYREIWLVDFEFSQPSGERPTVICMVAREFRSGRTIRAWADDLANMVGPPFPIGRDVLFVAYFASAEFSCFLAQDWPMPARVLDLYAEFRNLTNGLSTVAGNGLLGALAHFGLGAIDGAEKNEMRDLAIRGGPYTNAERSALLDYCGTDVVALAKLLKAMLPQIDLPRALLRGRYGIAVAKIERTGIPIDVPALDVLRANWGDIQTDLIHRVDADYHVFVPTDSKLNPCSAHGLAIIETAKDWGVNPHELADAVRYVWEEDREADRERREAILAVRRATGLTVNRVAKWERSGRDASTYLGFDVAARELAGEYPELGIGTGYNINAGYDETDYSGQLWALLREETPKPRPRTDPATLDRAAKMVAKLGGVESDGPRSFSTHLWAEFLIEADIPWPRLESGGLDLSDDVFRQMANAYPVVAPIRELRHTLSQLRLNDLAVGSDGRNRCLLSAFSSKTGRNQPSTAKFAFGPSCWLRGLIKPEDGRAIAYVDWSQQEFGIAAALSGDTTMKTAYLSGDPYLTFAQQAGAVPQGATKESHPREREQFKQCVLGVQYGMQSKTLAQRLGQPEALARELLRLHRTTYPTFWRWSQAAVDHAMLVGWLQTMFGWRVRVGPRANPRSLANFLMQAGGSEMLRLACCLATEAGVNVAAPIHDALLVEGPADSIDDVVAATQAAMAESSRIVLDGFTLRTDAEVVAWPNRYMDKRGKTMWDTIMGLLVDRIGDSPDCPPLEKVPRRAAPTRRTLMHLPDAP